MRGIYSSCSAAQFEGIYTTPSRSATLRCILGEYRDTIGCMYVYTYIYHNSLRAVLYYLSLIGCLDLNSALRCLIISQMCVSCQDALPSVCVSHLMFYLAGVLLLLHIQCQCHGEGGHQASRESSKLDSIWWWGEPHTDVL